MEVLVAIKALARVPYVGLSTYFAFSYYCCIKIVNQEIWCLIKLFCNTKNGWMVLVNMFLRTKDNVLQRFFIAFMLQGQNFCTAKNFVSFFTFPCIYNFWSMQVVSLFVLSKPCYKRIHNFLDSMASKLTFTKEHRELGEE